MKELTNEELTQIYKKANGITRKSVPLTTAHIFTAMREVRRLTLEEVHASRWYVRVICFFRRR